MQIKWWEWIYSWFYRETWISFWLTYREVVKLRMMHYPPDMCAIEGRRRAAWEMVRRGILTLDEYDSLMDLLYGRMPEKINGH